MIKIITGLISILGRAISQQTATLGVTDGKLVPCPNSPNCVFSQSSDKAHYIKPLQYEGTPAEARETLISVINSMDHVRIVTIKGNYIHAEFTSALFRFVDDVEFYFDDANKIIHLRSASRVGYYDLGVNRRRIENIRGRFIASITYEKRKKSNI